jgi:hypothetical protein
MCFYKIQRRESEKKKKNKFVWWVFYFMLYYTILFVFVSLLYFCNLNPLVFGEKS